MTKRIAFTQAAPDGYKALYGVEAYVKNCGIEQSLLELIRMRVSQINGCAYCLDMHSKDARAAGETEQRLYVLSAWREAPFYSERERAALAWVEAVTLLSTNDIPDELYEATRHHFSDKELVDITIATISINSWNRIAVPFRAPVGAYQPAKAKAA